MLQAKLGNPEDAITPERFTLNGSFGKLGVPYFVVLIIRILLFRVLNLGPLFSTTPTTKLLRPIL